MLTQQQREAILTDSDVTQCGIRGTKI